MAARAAGSASGLLGELIGSGAYPESEYGLAAYLFERIAQAEKEGAAKDRQYYLDLMAACLETVRDGAKKT
ncbi:MAG: hypothetical protein OEM59_16105 [Rhodospirillales bacterium]|nr:hypothetical protein [Rhodospirillales bacterium]